MPELSGQETCLLKISQRCSVPSWNAQRIRIIYPDSCQKAEIKKVKKKKKLEAEMGQKTDFFSLSQTHFLILPRSTAPTQLGLWGTIAKSMWTKCPIHPVSLRGLSNQLALLFVFLSFQVQFLNLEQEGGNGLGVGRALAVFHGMSQVPCLQTECKTPCHYCCFESPS